MTDREAILAAIENRRRGPVAPHSTTPAPISNSSTSIPKYSHFDQDHDRRQEFRRLVDPGITRQNSREVAYEAIKTLLMLAQNVIDHPREEKYHRFKSTNPAIQKKIVDPKGTLEYAVQLGFRPEVIDFQPYYVFHKSSLKDLGIGLAVLKEFEEREAEKAQRLAKAKAEEKAAIEAQKEKTRLAFLDDRKSKILIDEREKQHREALAARLPSSELETAPAPPPFMPGGGHLLSGLDHPMDVLDE